MPTYVIAGASLAGAKAAETLREEGFDGDIVLLGAELERPYERPPLSKGYLLGTQERDSAYVHPGDWYAEHRVELRTGVTVTAIDRAAATVTTSGPAGTETLRYEFRPGTRVAVAGAGWIGLETAAAARQADCTVTVLEPQPGALHAQLGPELGRVFEGLHRSHG